MRLQIWKPNSLRAEQTSCLRYTLYNLVFTRSKVCSLECREYNLECRVYNLECSVYNLERSVYSLNVEFSVQFIM